VATDPPADLILTPINGDARTIDEWLTTFQLALVVLDPFTNESAWLLETAGKVLTHFTGADCRVAFVITGTADDARQFLGPWAERILTFADPDRAFVKAVGLNEVPAFLQIRGDRKVVGAAEGWDPHEWRDVAHRLAHDMSWSAPLIPEAGDPSPYAGSAAAG
jgi:hypothetical protein